MATTRVLPLVFLFAIIVQCFAAQGPPSEDDIRKMKVRDLKDFLKDRGVVCEGCVEKEDFVKKALASREMQVVNTKKLPDAPIHKHWGTLAHEICEKELSADHCKSLKSVVELSVDEFKRKFSRELGVTEKHLFGITLAAPYKDAGLIHIRKVIHWMKKTDTKSSSKIREKYQKLFVPWLRDCAVENPNEMYSTIKNKNKHDEL